MLKIGLLSLFPDFTRAYGDFGPIRRARELGLVRIDHLQLRDYSEDRHGSVDDRPYGGGDGMILRIEPLVAAVEAWETGARIIVTSPGGQPFCQEAAEALAASKKPLLFVCGRFGGIDQRFIDGYADENFSIGPFVTSGGELPALAMVDASVRLLPGALGNAESSVNDSFSGLLRDQIEAPSYTRPALFRDQEVPKVLLSGNHERIASWREQARRPKP